VLRDAGVAVETACEQGVCGTCVTSVVEGEPDHRDSVLSEEERRGEGLMTICRSPAKSARLVLEL
jgi:vanillate O-demethylase ferredoxin subunit